MSQCLIRRHQECSEESQGVLKFVMENTVLAKVCNGATKRLGLLLWEEIHVHEVVGSNPALDGHFSRCKIVLFG